MKFTIITLFPDFFSGALQAGLLGKAIAAGLIEVELVDLRKYGEGKHLHTDDAPYGGGSGMVMKAQPVVSAIEEVKRADPDARVVLLTPQGEVFSQGVARRWSLERSMVFVCGRYEGFDERIRAWVDEEASLGDFVLMGGEAAALTMVDATARLVSGVLGDPASTVEESHSNGLLEYPHYTRPRVFRGMEVPEVLLSGNHAEIKRWREEMSLARTEERRPDLLGRGGAKTSSDERGDKE